MSTVSMTGFGRGQAEANGFCVEVELSSVNRKQLDVRVNLPRALLALESRIHELVRERMHRGQVCGTVRVVMRAGAVDGRASLDQGTAKAVVNALRHAARELELKDDLGVSALAQIPGVLTVVRDADNPEKLWPAVKRATEKALAGLVAMRRTEGKALAQDLMPRIAGMSDLCEQIACRVPAVRKRYERNLRARLKAAGVDVALDDATLMKEVVLFAEKSDISEEIVRLRSHFEHVGKLMRSRKPSGRALDFLCQEMFREINTIGSKAGDSGVSRCVVQFKAELESLREQVQNVE